MSAQGIDERMINVHYYYYSSVWLISVYQSTRRFFLWEKLQSPIAFSSTWFQIPPMGAMFQTVGSGTGGRSCMWVHRWEQCWSDRVLWHRLAPLLPCMACAFSVESVCLLHSPSLSPRPPQLAQEWLFPPPSSLVWTDMNSGSLCGLL